MDPTTPTTSVPETSPAAPSLEPELGTTLTDGVPSDSGSLDGEHHNPSDGEFDTLGSQIARTDAALVAWRDESVRRRAEYDEQVAQARAAADLRRRRNVRLGLLAGAVGVFTLTTLAVVVGLVLRPEPVAVAPAPVAAPVVAAPAVAAPVVAAPVVAAPVASAAVAPVAASPVAASPSKAPGLAIEEGTARVWATQQHVWVAFRAAEAGPIRLHWKDAAGDEVLESMRCGSVDCRAGRSHGRIAAALAAGAAPGSWTIEACGPAGCVDVGTFAAPGSPR